MFKKLPLALMIGAMFVVSNVLALGVGDIKVDSALNQRLDAEIELISSIEGELDDVSVSLASASAFRRIKLDRPYHLTSIQFKVTTRADGTPIVKLTSTETIREPFLDFLVEVNWPKGHMLREYTVLLDPPVSIVAKSAAPEPAIASEAKGTLEPSESAAADTGDGVGYPGDDLGYTGDNASQPSYSGDSYGPVEANQTLWGISNQVRAGEVTNQQMMLALFDANPEAFIDGNIHNIKKGAVLRIPDHQTIVSRNVVEALAEVREVNANLDFLPTSSTTTEQPGVPEELAPTEDEGLSETSEDNLKLLAAEEGTSSTTGSSAEVDTLKRELTLASETMASQKMQNEELQSRVDELEAVTQEMTKLQRLLELQNEEMQRMQQQLAGEQASQAPAEIASEEVAEVETEETSTETAPEADHEMKTAVEPAQPQDTPVAPVSRRLPPPAQKQPMDMVMDYVNKIKDSPMLMGIAGAVLLVLIALVALVFKRKGGDEIKPAPAAVPETKASKPSLFAGLQEKMQGLMKKKEKSEPIEMDFEEDTDDNTDITDPGVSAAVADDAVDATVFEAPNGDAGGVADMAFEMDNDVPSPDTTQDSAASDLSGDASPAEPTGPDPLEEVDVYEAFGDFDQAAVIVKQAIADEPNNNAFKLRLFKVYEAGGMTAEYATAAAEYQSDMTGTPEWAEIEATGKTFAPDSPAWGGGGSEPAPAADVDMSATMAIDPAADSGDGQEAAAEFDLGDLNFETDESTPDESAALATDTVQMDGESTQALDDSANVAVAAGDNSNEVEFDMDSMDFESADEPAMSETIQSEPQEGDSFEMDIGGMDFETPEQSSGTTNTDATPDQADVTADNSLEFDMGGMDFESPEAPASAASDSDMSMEFELDDNTAVQTESAADEGSFETLQLDVSADELEAGSNSDAPGSEDPTLMFDEGQSVTTAANETETDTSMGVDLSDFSFEMDESGSADALDVGGDDPETLLNESDDSLGQSLSAEGDEVSTKLDLARAYIDMGDSDGAKGILDEVVAEGNDSQKAEAQDLLQSA